MIIIRVFFFFLLSVILSGKDLTIMWSSFWTQQINYYYKKVRLEHKVFFVNFQEFSFTLFFSTSDYPRSIKKLWLSVFLLDVFVVEIV